jgi:hypothetical protein
LNSGIWIDDTVIQAFFEVHHYKKHQNTLIVTPFDAFSFGSMWTKSDKPFCKHKTCQQKREELKTFYCKDYDKKFKQCQQFSAIANFRSTHWVVLEFDLVTP